MSFLSRVFRQHQSSERRLTHCWASQQWHPIGFLSVKIRVNLWLKYIHSGPHGTSIDSTAIAGFEAVTPFGEVFQTNRGSPGDGCERVVRHTHRNPQLFRQVDIQAPQ